MKEESYEATGRRKRSVARVRLIPGSGRFLVAKKPIKEYFKRESLVQICEQPFEVTETVGKFDCFVRVNGGGISGQAGAVQLGIARALLAYNAEFKKKLREFGLLTRDSREKERMKYGLAKRRKRYQYSKR